MKAGKSSTLFLICIQFYIMRLLQRGCLLNYRSFAFIGLLHYEKYWSHFQLFTNLAILDLQISIIFFEYSIFVMLDDDL